MGLGLNGSYGFDMMFSDIKVVVFGIDVIIMVDVKVIGIKGLSSKEVFEINLDDVKIFIFKLSEVIVLVVEKIYIIKGV